MSEVEQGEGQSLEDILSSIRQKISADPDMAAPATTEPSALQPVAETDPLATSPIGQPSDGVLSPSKTEEITGRLSDILSAPSNSQPLSEIAPGFADDDLSDLLEDPLPSPRDQAGDKNTKSADGINDVLAPIATPTPWPSIGLTADKQRKAFGNGAVATKPQKVELGAFVPAKSRAGTIDDVTAPSKNGLAAKLNETAQPSAKSSTTAASKSGQPTPVAKKSDSAAPEQPASLSSPGATASQFPRSMSALSTGFAMPAAAFESSTAGKGLPNTPASKPTSPVSNVAKSETPSSSASPIAALEKQSTEKSASTSKPLAAPAQNITASTAGSANVSSAKDKSDLPTATPISEAPFDTAAPTSKPTISLAPTAQTSQPAAATKTLEDTVAELLRPMLYEWLEANMPRIVENTLRIEGMEISRGSNVEAKG